MRSGLLLTILFLSSFAKAGDGYHNYLLSRLASNHPVKTIHTSIIVNTRQAEIPRYQIPKGNIFCRMEDKLTRATKVWIKIGVK